MELVQNRAKTQKNGLSKQLITLKMKNNEAINPSNIKKMAKDLADKFEKKYKRLPSMQIRVRNIQGNIHLDSLDPAKYITIKKLSKEIDDLCEDYEQYLDGRVKDDTKFMEFFAVQYELF